MRKYKKSEKEKSPSSSILRGLLYIVLFVLFYYSLGLIGAPNISLIMQILPYLLLFTIILLIVELIRMKKDEMEK